MRYLLLKDYQIEKSDFEEFKNDITSFSPDIVVISTTNATILDDLKFIEQIKSFHPCEFIVKGAIFF